MSDRVRAELAVTRRLYPNSKVDQKTIDLYVEELADLPEEQVVQGIIEARRTGGEFFPALPTIRRAVIDVMGNGVIVVPETAWAEVMREVKRVGYNPPGRWEKGKHHDPPQRRFSSPVIEAAVEAVGWRDICLSDIEDLPTIRAQFRKALEAYQNRAIRDIAAGRTPQQALPGWTSTNDMLTGGQDE